jgi:hypothetical protein
MLLSKTRNKSATMNRIARLLENPQAPAIILGLSMLLMATSLLTGFFGDDYIHYALLSPENRFLKPNDASLFGLFSFVNGDSGRNQLLRDLGLIPWWTFDGLKYAFWRPLSEITHWIDHSLWPRSATLMHLHNMAWYLLLCSTVLAVYRKVSAQRHGLFIAAALAFYALDATHGFAVSWISNRNSLIAATLGMASFLAYLSHRETGQSRTLIASMLLLIGSLLSAEAGVSSLAYFGAYALALDKRGPVRGVIAILPHGLLFIAWWLTYKALGFGAAHADSYYVDPTANPGFYLLKLLERIPVLLSSQFGFLPAEIYGFAGRTIPEYLIICVAFLALVCWILYRVIATSPAARFWCLAMIFSVAPIASALPHDRNLIFVGIGASALLGLLFTAKQKPDQAPRSAWSYLAICLLALNLVIGTALTPITAYLPKIWNAQMQLSATELPFSENLTNENVLILGTPLAAALAITPLNYFHQKPLPKRVWIISTDTDTYTLHRTSSTQLQVTKKTPFVSPLEQSLRNLEKHPFKDGDNIQLTGASISVGTTNANGQPTQLTITIDQNEIDRTKIAAWNGASYDLINLPTAGNSIEVRAGSK